MRSSSMHAGSLTRPRSGCVNVGATSSEEHKETLAFTMRSSKGELKFIPPTSQADVPVITNNSDVQRRAPQK